MDGIHTSVLHKCIYIYIPRTAKQQFQCCLVNARLGLATHGERVDQQLTTAQRGLAADLGSALKALKKDNGSRLCSYILFLRAHTVTVHVCMWLKTDNKCVYSAVCARVSPSAGRKPDLSVK